ncbi:hypothetical protein UA42_12050 [Photobacterium kishitanii]|nr:hypothetical protein UA42_12050 [Photobacterium kishitanii]KJG65260.1 hypothetical protein UA40_12500 [Photobacterium kishitanii]
MRKYQRGVTLLETILVVAILGGVLAYSGTLLMKSVKINQLEKAAEKIVQLQKVIKEYSTTVYLSKDGAASVPNPLLISSSIADEVMRDDLLWLKSNNCKIPGVISDDVDRTYLTCEYNPNAIDLEYISTNFEFVEYKNASYIDAKRFATTATSLYVGQTKNAEGFLSIVSRIDDVKNEDGYRLSSERVSLGLFRKAGGIYTLEPSKPLIKLSDFVGNDVSIISDYVRDVDQGGYYPGFYINSFYNEEISLKRDGSIPLQKERRLCWDSERGTIESCLSSITEENGGKHYNYIVAENSGFIYGQDKKKNADRVITKNIH